MKNNFKRVFALLIAVVMCVTCVLPVFASDAAVNCPGVDAVHTKDNCDEVQVGDPVAPTCDAAGYTSYQCTVCNKGFADDIIKSECNVTTTTVDATCVTDGYILKYCNTHDKEVSKTILPALDQVNDPKQHTWDAGTENTETGKIDYTCTVCGETKSEDKDPHTVHVWGDAVLNPDKLPTCTEDGEATVYCTTDGCTASKTIFVSKTSDLAQHTWDLANYEVISEKTCASYAIWKVTCSVCGAINNEYEDVAGGTSNHDFSIQVEAEAPTCATAGWIAYYKCSTGGCIEISVDGINIADPDDVVDPKLAHVWVDDPENPDIAPVCGEDGKDYSKCQNCGEKKVDTIPTASQHSFNTDPLQVAPTCTTKGVKVTYCINEGCTLPATTEYIPMLDHHLADCTDHEACLIANNGVACGLEVIDTTPGNCGSVGTTTYGCKLCKDNSTGVYAHTVIVENTASAGNGQHNYETVTIPATCKDEGSTYQKCTVCGAETTHETLPVDPDAHQYHNFDPADPEGSGYVVVTAPTCTESGSAWRYCKLCEEKDTTIKTLDPLGHTMPTGTTPTVEATCQNKASYTYVCTVCGVSVTEEQGELADHDYEEHIAVSADCENDGNEKYYTCKTPGCTEIFDADKNAIDAIPTIPATGHDWEDLPWVAPTCTNPIVFEEEKCGNCNATQHKKNAVGGEIYHVVDRTDATQHDCTHDAAYVPEIKRPGSCSVSAMEIWACTSAATADVTADVIVASDPSTGDIIQTITLIPKGTTYGVENEAYGRGHVADAIYMEILTGDEAVTATCLVEGKTAKYTCSFCNETIGGESLGYADHTYEEHAAVAPTCTMGGNEKYYVCIAPGCGDYFDENKNSINSIPYVNALGHEEVTTTREATCLEDGGTTTTCTRCNTEISSNPVAKTGHDYVTVLTKAVSCDMNQDGTHKLTAYGYIHVRCQNPLCSYDEVKNYEESEYVYEFKYPIDHTMTIVKDCLEGDVETCSVCGYYVEHEARGEHKNVGGDVLNCSNVGTVTDRICVDCGEEIVHATIHSKVTATCTQDGYEIETCRDCPYFYVVEGSVVPALGHDEPDDYTYADKNADGVIDDNDKETCMETATKVKVCGRCGETLDTITVEKKAHVFETYTTVVEAGIGTPGSKEAVCEYGCGTKDVLPIDPLKGILFDLSYDNAIKADYDFVNTGRVAVTITYTAYQATVSSVVLALSFDPTVMTYDGSDPESAFTGFVAGNCDIGFNNERGKVNINANTDSSEGVSEVTLNTTDAVLCTIYFNIADLAAMNTPLTLTVVGENEDAGTSAVNKNGDPVAVDVEDFEIPTVVRLGDVNKDNVVNDADTVALLNISFANGYLAQADINQDGIVDINDYRLLKRCALQKITYAEMCEGEEA